MNTFAKNIGFSFEKKKLIFAHLLTLLIVYLIELWLMISNAQWRYSGFQVTGMIKGFFWV